MTKKEKKERKKARKRHAKAERMSFYDQYVMTHGYVNAKQALEARDNMFKTSSKN